jgi:hypothetical protein
MWAHHIAWEVGGMNLTATRLTATAGLCAAAAGAIFVGVQIDHPPADVAHVATTDMVVRESAKVLMSVLALIGIAGLFLRHRSRFGVLGLAGFALLSVGYLAMFATECVVGYVLPAIAHANPAYVQGVIDAAMGRGTSVDIGHMRELLLAMGIGYPFGGLLFGVALFRARVVSRWASLLLAYGTVSVLALAALPESFSRPFAVPTGVALIGLGVSLWRTARRRPVTADAPATAWIAEPAGASS